MPYYILWLSKSKEVNPITLRKAKIVYSFGLSECNRVMHRFLREILKLKCFYFYSSTFIMNTSWLQQKHIFDFIHIFAMIFHDI